ncbi:MAG: HD domain-containing protein [Bacteroidetes bacterium]|nr:HD domain-containing protein [Bacteroidota bacterium]
MEFANPLRDDQYKERLRHRENDVRGEYFRDQTAIIHSMPYRRLKHKTQVYFSPNNDHICTRIEHALHVATIAATISKGLGLNTDMAYAIGLGHDLGHAPFGHAGETVLNLKCKDIGGFIHEIHGLRVADVLGSRGVGLNLTYGVRDGIICHCGEAPDKEIQPRPDVLDLTRIAKRDKLPSSWEGCVTRIADRIAYLGRDLEDSIDGGFVEEYEIPKIIQKELGESNGEIIDNLVVDVITNSQKEGKIAFSESKYEVLMELYKFSVDKIYSHEKITRYKKYCERIITELFDYLISLYNKWDSDIEAYYKSPCPLDTRFGWYLEKMKKIYDVERSGAFAIVRDYVAGMTDVYALKCMKEISFPEELSFDRRFSMPNKANSADAKSRAAD